jgi:serine/threonine protein kinase
MSSKSDIYSLGVIVKELVTGSKEKPSIPKVRVINLTLDIPYYI